MNQLLEQSRRQLLRPLGNARRTVLIILNIVSTILIPVFLVSEKIATGNFVNDSILYLVYGIAVLCNLISAVYNIRCFIKSDRKQESTFGNRKLDVLSGYTSVIPILFMSCCNMLGLGNPSNDSILTDFALAQSLMIVTVVILGRRAVVVWFLVVVSILVWNVSSRGWNYEYNYLTPAEALHFKEALVKNDSAALYRQAELEKAGLNPPKISRYFNTWLVFIIVAFVVAYFFSGITIDILKIVPSVAKNIEEALEGNKMAEAEQRANQEKTNTFINLAHETKTPLTLLNNYLDEYIKKYGRNREIEIIKWNVQRMTTDVVNFFDLERFSKGFNYDHNQVTNLSDILTKKLPLYKSLAKRKSIKIEECIDEGCFVLAHPGGIERIVNNLIENAVKFTSKNGTIKISLCTREGYVHLFVEDNGVGIPDHFQDRIFEPYSQLGPHRNNEGMGMGLVIVKKIVDHLKGRISLTSELNKGTYVEVAIPCHEPVKDDVQVEFEVSENVNLHLSESAIGDSIVDSGRPYLLLVEDNQAMLSYLVENLRDKYNVYVARNGAEALEKLKSISVLDLIISDVMMEVKTGFELCKEVLANRIFSHIPFIFLTAKTSVYDKLEGLRLGAVGYIEKPFLISQLLLKVESLLNYNEKQRIAFVSKVQRLMPGSDQVGIYYNDVERYSAINFESNCRKFNLTAREIEISKLIIKGMTYSAVSYTLNISDKTVAKHVQNIFGKVGAGNKIELINKLQETRTSEV